LRSFAPNPTPRFTRWPSKTPWSVVSAATFFETAIVIDGTRDPIASRRLDDFLRAANITIEPVTGHQAHIARQAYRDYAGAAGIRRDSIRRLLRLRPRPRNGRASAV